MFKKTPQVRVLFNCWRRQAQFMMLGVILFTLIAASVVTVVQPQRAVAAANNNLNFQARLQTASGAVVPDGEYNIQFKLYDDDTAGSLLWSESWYDSNGATAGNDNRLLVKNGYFSANLGAQTAFPTTIDWDQDLWLTMRVGGSAQTGSPSYDTEMDPRLKLTGVPYAFRAGELAKHNNATGYTGLLQFQNTTGGNQTFIIPDQGAAGTYTLMTEESLAGAAIQNGTGVQSNANIAIQSAADSSVTALLKARGGQSADILQLTDSSNAVLMNVTSAGNVGITNNASISGLVGVGVAATGGEQLRVQTSSASVVGLSIVGSASQTADLLKIDGNGTRAFNYSSNGGLYLTAGSGQSANLLTLEDSGSNVVARFTAAGSLQTSSLDTVTAGTLDIGATNATGITLSKNTTIASGQSFTANGSALFKINSNTTTAFQIQPSASTTPVFNADTTNSRIGIGTATPRADLDIGRDGGQLTIGGNGSGGAVTFGNETLGNALHFGNSALNVYTTQDNGFRIYTDYDLDTATPEVLIGANGSATFRNNTDTTTGFSVQNASGTSLFNVDSTNSRVGINKNDPGYTLDVAGDINTSGAYRVGGTSGATTTCSGGQLLQNAVVAGGIITGGSCVAAGGSGVTTVGTINSQTKSADGAVISGTSIYLQTADATSPGLVSTGAQTFAGAKTFSGAILQSGGAISLTANNTSFFKATSGTLTFTAEADGDTKGQIVLGSTGNVVDINTGGSGTVNVGGGSTTTVNVGSLHNVARTTNVGTGGGSNTQTQTVNVGSVANVSATTIQGGTGSTAINLTTGTNGSINITANGTGDITIRGDQTLFKPIANTTTAFQIQPTSSTTPVFNVDTTNGRIGIGKNNPSYTLDIVGDLNLSSGSQIRINGNDICDSAGCAPASDSTNYVHNNNSNMLTGQNGNLYITSKGNYATARFQQKLFGTGDIIQAANGVGSINMSIDYHGAAFFKPTDVGTSTFQIQDNGGTNMFNVDSTNSRVYIGGASADSTGTVLVLDTKNTSGDPTGVAGAMYYNSNTGRFRCYEGSSWKNCLSRNDYTPAYIGNTADSNSGVGVGPATSGTGTANYANMVAVTVPTPSTITGIRVVMDAYLGTAGNVDVGLYDNSGTRLASSGSVAAPASGAAATVSFTSSVAIEPGIYWLAVASDQVGLNTDTGSGPRFKRYGIDGAGGTRAFASSFPLPSTVNLGSPSGAGIPFTLMGIVSGGVTP